MALVVGGSFPEHEATALSIAVATTIIFALLGPWLTVLAARRAGRH
ncbi:hypothetical protein [Pseudoroseicyclus tamaricis]|uniref:Uncharacterized protein n=1 Tax=Pseudoroseicyclus tamaricis TaxID=2705421 RepID=A0A6B2JNP2_9RHOB|nr:hypothetical protein [Pseudoroseicyclus tamaricis]NDV00307.1 hypothetical protein [Pseudoroseicyclus tamaricis]